MTLGCRPSFAVAGTLPCRLSTCGRNGGQATAGGMREGTDRRDRAARHRRHECRDRRSHAFLPKLSTVNQILAGEYSAFENDRGRFERDTRTATYVYGEDDFWSS